MSSAQIQFLEIFRESLSQGTFVKCTLSRPALSGAEDLRNVFLRPVQLKKGMHIAFNYRYKTRDEVKNYLFAEATDRMEQLLGSTFLNADLFTGAGDFSIQFHKNGTATLHKKGAGTQEPVSTSHNREKKRLLNPAAHWLHQLGITSAKGEVLAAAQDKWKQINKYLEIIEHLVRENPLPPQPVIADMGSGKGYLTFALYEYLRANGFQPSITGIELRKPLVDFCNGIATEAGFEGLHFVALDIKTYQPERLDMLIALHACDTATDLALAAGIHQHAHIIVVAPCCHKQIRRDMQTQNELAPILRYGILEERQAEIVTDGIRALLLESEGYKTQVFEFISTEHTAKNVMITAVGGASDTGTKSKAPGPKRTEALAKIEALKYGFGVKEHFLEQLLRET